MSFQSLLISEELLVVTAPTNNISRTYIIKRIAEESIHAFVLICCFRSYKLFMGQPAFK